MDHQRDTPGSLPPEEIGERDRVGTTTPEQYPESDREGARVDRPGQDKQAPQ